MSSRFSSYLMALLEGVLEDPGLLLSACCEVFFLQNSSTLLLGSVVMQTGHAPKLLHVSRVHTGCNGAERTGCTQDVANTCCNRLMSPGCTQLVGVRAETIP